LIEYNHTHSLNFVHTPGSNYTMRKIVQYLSAGTGTFSLTYKLSQLYLSNKFEERIIYPSGKIIDHDSRYILGGMKTTC